MADTADPQPATPANTIPATKAQKALDHYRTRIESLKANHLTLKAEIDKIAKDLGGLGQKVGDPLNLIRPIIDEDLIEKAVEALKNGGLNVKAFQMALGIYDAMEAKRKRNALIAAGVTVETENFRGTNTTWIELTDEWKD